MSIRKWLPASGSPRPLGGGGLFHHLPLLRGISRLLGRSTSRKVEWKTMENRGVGLIWWHGQLLSISPLSAWSCLCRRLPPLYYAILCNARLQHVPKQCFSARLAKPALDFHITPVQLAFLHITQTQQNETLRWDRRQDLQGSKCDWVSSVSEVCLGVSIDHHRSPYSTQHYLRRF